MWKNMCSFDFSHKETSWNSQDTHKKPPLFFPAQERKPSPSVWTRLQFPHSKVFNLTKCHLHQLCHDSYTATYSLWLLVLKKKKNQLNTHSPPPFLQHTSHVVMIVSKIYIKEHITRCSLKCLIFSQFSA